MHHQQLWRMSVRIACDNNRHGGSMPHLLLCAECTYLDDCPHHHHNYMPSPSLCIPMVRQRVAHNYSDTNGYELRLPHVCARSRNDFLSSPPLSSTTMWKWIAHHYTDTDWYDLCLSHLCA